MTPLIFEDWGLIDYTQALRLQEQYVEEVRSHQRPATAIFCQHPPTVTTGRGTLPGDILDWMGSIHEINRGGRATYHGPSQIVVYVILPLSEASTHRPARDIGSFLRQFEIAIVRTLFDFGVTAQGKSLQRHAGAETAREETGVWVGNRKIASLGISVRHWITFHGAALNIDHDPTAFQGIRPCGFEPSIMVSLQELLGTPLNRTQIVERLQVHLLDCLA